MDTHELTIGFLNELQEDDVGLWAIIWAIRYALNDNNYPSTEQDKSDPADVRSMTMEVVRELLATGRVSAGYYDPDGGGIIPWNLPAHEIVPRINSAWDSLGREPNIGVVVLFSEKSRQDE